MKLTELEVLLELKNFLHELDLGNVDRLFVDGSCNILEKALNTLLLFKSALTLDTMPVQAQQTVTADESISLTLQQAYSYVRHELDAEGKKALTQWVIENIDKDKVMEWLGVDK